MLTDKEVNTILIATGNACRHRKRPLDDLQPNYVAKLRRIANDTIYQWAMSGVPATCWDTIKTSSLITKYNLFEGTTEPTKTVRFQTMFK